MTPETCIFCEIVAGRSPADIIVATDNTLIFRPLNPVTGASSPTSATRGGRRTTGPSPSLGFSSLRV